MCSIVSWTLGDLANLSTVVIAGCAVFGVFAWKKQKRIENSCVDAKKGLEVCEKVKCSVGKMVRVARPQPGVTTSKHQEEAINEFIFSLGEFQGVLFLLEYNSKVGPILDWIKEVRVEFTKATFENGNKIEPCIKLIHGLEKIDPEWEPGQVEFKKLEEVKNILLDIYEIRYGFRQEFIMKFADKFNKDPIWVAIRYLIFFGVFFVLGFFSFWFFSLSWVPVWVESWRGFVGAILGVVAVVAKLGGRTWGRNTLPEKVDRWFFWIFSGISFFLLI